MKKKNIKVLINFFKKKYHKATKKTKKVVKKRKKKVVNSQLAMPVNTTHIFLYKKIVATNTSSMCCVVYLILDTVKFCLYCTCLLVSLKKN